MELERTDRRDWSPSVGMMVLALVLAAFTGAALGLVWQSAGFGDEPEAPAADE